MSIIAVHGPNTWGSKGTVATSTVNADAAANNGLKWTFSLNSTSTRADQDFSWAFPPNGTPTPQTVKAPTQVTYATAGSKTATLTVTDTQRTISNKALTSNVATLTTSATHGFKVGQTVVVSGVDATFNGTYVIASTPTGTTFTFPLTAANVTSGAATGTVASSDTQFPPAGSYPLAITATAGTAPLLLEGDQSQGETVDVSEFMRGERPDGAVTEPAPDGDSEYASAGFDPAAHTVAEVEQYVDEHPEEAEQILQLEEEGKARVTLLTYLESLVDAE